MRFAVGILLLAGLGARSALAQPSASSQLTALNCYLHQDGPPSASGQNALMRVSVALSKASQSESIPKNFALDDPNSLFGKEGVNSVQVNDSLIAGKSFLIFRFGRTGGKMFYLAVDQANIGPANIEKLFSVLAVEENHATGDINASENRFAGECYVYRFDDTSSLDTAFEQLKGLPKMETFEGSVQ